jgi:hypothetical protein
MIKRTVRWLRNPQVFPLVLVMALLIALGAAGTAGANSPPRALLQQNTPTMINYQGTIKVGGSPFNGTGYFKFAVVDAATGDGTTNYWANDGTASGEPAAPLSLAVSGGLFNVLLGDTSLTGMTQVLDEPVFAHDPTYLRVWFSQTGTPGTFEALEPNQRIVSVAYALHAKYAENGPAGPEGETGPTGPVGPQGPEGPTGATGPQGPAGETGPTGPQGPVGATGASGPQGPEGATGPSGPSGPPGPTGSQGPQGPSGPTGPAGPSGPTGPVNITVTGEYNITSDGQGWQYLDMVSALPTGHSMCWLTYVESYDTNKVNELVRCTVEVSGRNWRLGAYSTAGEDNAAECSARCLEW